MISTEMHLDLSRIAQDLQIRKIQVESVVQLLDEGNTIPFITRYRKERTGGLDEEVLRIVQERMASSRQLADRKQTILNSIETQGKLTEELRNAILGGRHPSGSKTSTCPTSPRSGPWPPTARERGWNRSPWPSGTAIRPCANLASSLPTLVNPRRS